MGEIISVVTIQGDVMDPQSEVKIFCPIDMEIIARTKTRFTFWSMLLAIFLNIARNMDKRSFVALFRRRSCPIVDVNIRSGKVVR